MLCERKPNNTSIGENIRYKSKYKCNNGNYDGLYQITGKAILSISVNYKVYTSFKIFQIIFIG